MNVELLKAVRDFIVKHPRNVDMECVERDTTLCGTVGCIAGWTLILNGTDFAHISQEGLNWESEAAQLLEIPHVDSRSLFYACYWPGDLRKRLLKSKGQKYANIVAERIDRFIEDDRLRRTA